MFYWLTQQLADHVSTFHIFSYITFRTILSAATALVVSLIVGPLVIRKLESLQIGAVIRDDGPERHLQKAGTPTMGGALILITILISVFLWADLQSRQVWVIVFILVTFGAVGWYDDYLQVSKRNVKGLSAKLKYSLQSVFAASVAVYLWQTASTPAETELIVPFFKEIAIPLGFGYVILTYFLIVGMSNAVNLTDGLDGLAIMPTVMVVGALGLIAYAVGHVEFAAYLQIPYIEGTGEVAIVCGAVIGAGLGFLWFNAYPAQVIMGDLGALSLGAALGVIGVLVRHEIVLLVMGGLFVLETASVIVQVVSFKLVGRRLFRMAPIHHHFELKGWPESRIIVRFWIIAFMLVMVGLSTLKIR